MAFGTLCHKLGAGRTKPTDNIDMGVGVELSVTVGDYINKGKIGSFHIVIKTFISLALGTVQLGYW